MKSVLLLTPTAPGMPASAAHTAAGKRGSHLNKRGVHAAVDHAVWLVVPFIDRHPDDAPVGSHFDELDAEVSVQSCRRSRCIPWANGSGAWWRTGRL